MGTAGHNGKDGDFFVSFKLGEYVYREGDEGDSMYIIEDGGIEIVTQSSAGERKLAVLVQGDFFGEVSVLDDLPREASARASAPSQLLRIDKITFDQMIHQNPEIAAHMLRKLARRLRSVNASRQASQPPVPAARTSARSTAPPGAPAPLTVPVAAPEIPPPAATVPRAYKLVSETTGEAIPLPEKAEITIGRPDPIAGTAPDIDLTTEDTNRSVSRRHARIYRRTNGFFVREETGVVNGTFVNNQRIPTGEAVPLAENDLVSFGRVAMAFRGD